MFENNLRIYRQAIVLRRLVCNDNCTFKIIIRAVYYLASVCLRRMIYNFFGIAFKFYQYTHLSYHGADQCSESFVQDTCYAYNTFSMISVQTFSRIVANRFQRRRPKSRLDKLTCIVRGRDLGWSFRTFVKPNTFVDKRAMTEGWWRLYGVSRSVDEKYRRESGC